MSDDAYSLGDNTYASPQDLVGLGGEFTPPAGWTDADQQQELLRASKLIDSITGQHFGYSSMTLLLSGKGTPMLRTNAALSWRIVDITSVHERDDYSDSFSTQVATDDFTISVSRRALVRTDGCVWKKCAIKNYRVIGHFGRKLVPKPIMWCCVLIARNNIVPGSAAEYDQLQSESFGDGYSYSRQLPSAPALPRRTGIPQVDTILSAYISNRPLMSVPGQ